MRGERGEALACRHTKHKRPSTLIHIHTHKFAHIRKHFVHLHRHLFFSTHATNSRAVQPRTTPMTRQTHEAQTRSSYGSYRHAQQQRTHFRYAPRRGGNRKYIGPRNKYKQKSSYVYTILVSTRKILVSARKIHTRVENDTKPLKGGLPEGKRRRREF